MKCKCYHMTKSSFKWFFGHFILLPVLVPILKSEVFEFENSNFSWKVFESNLIESVAVVTLAGDRTGLALDMSFVGISENKAIVDTGTATTRHCKLLWSIWWPDILDKSITDFAIETF